jgi:hypothetical protein
MTHRHSKTGWVQRFLRWLFGSPFQALPPEFGDPVPPDLKAFEAESEEIEHRARTEELPSQSAHARHTRRVRRDGSMEQR